MNLLELAQDVARECGISNSQATPVPAAIAGQMGELERVIGWVRKAWLDIQGRRLWNFLWERPTLVLLTGTNTLAGTIPVSRYVVDSAIRVGLTPTSDGLDLQYVDWFEWGDWYSDAYIAVGNAPTAFTIRPDNTLVFNGQASVAQTGGDMAFTIERYKNPQELVLDTDEPAMPSDLHDLIVQKAIVRYANFDEAGSTRTTAIAEIARLERDLIARCLPQMRLGPPLT